MSIQEKQLGQSRPANTTAVSIYSPATSTTAVVTTVFICNTTASSAKFRLFCDDDGTTYDETSALHWDVNVPASDTVEINTKIMMNNSSGNMAVRTDTANALTFTVFGAEFT